MNSAAVDMVHASPLIRVFSGCVPRSGIKGSYSGSTASFWGTSMPLSIAAVAVYISNSIKVKGN